jgi:hypothetical protein
MTSSHTHTQAHHFLGRLSQLNCFPTMTENNRGKKNLYRVGWWGKKHFPLFNFFSKEAGGPHCCVQPKPEEGERTLLYTTTTYTTPPTRWFSCGQVSLYYIFTILFCPFLCLCLCLLPGGKMRVEMEQKNRRLSLAPTGENLESFLE